MLWHPGVNEADVARTRQLLNSALHWYRADTVTLSGANLATMPNRGTGGGAMAVTMGTLAAPAPVASLNGAPAVQFTGPQQLQSNLPASAFSYMHQNGHTFAVITGVDDNAVVFSTRPATGGAGDTGISAYRYTGNLSTQIYDNGDKYLALRPSDSLSHLVEVAADSAVYPQAFTAEDGIGFGPSDYPGLTKDAALPLTFSLPQLPNPMRIAEFISFDRRLLPYERQLMFDYVRTRYGLSLPTMTGVDREVLKLNPYSWIRADRYVDNAGKVSAFPDLVLPLHAMGQGTAAMQVDVPVADALFGGQLVATFAGDQRYISNFPKAAWTFLHDGTGAEMTARFAAESATGRLLNTIDMDVNFPGTALQASTNSTIDYYIFRGDGTFPWSAAPLTNNKSRRVHASYSIASSPNRRASTVEGVSAGEYPSPSASPSEITYTLGGHPSGGFDFVGRVADALAFRRELTDAERAVLAAYDLAHFGGDTP